MKGLSREHNITLVTTIDKKEQHTYISELQKVCHTVRTIEIPYETKFRLGIKLVKSLFSPTPIVVERHYVPEVAEEIKRLMRTGLFDIVHFDHLDASFYFKDIAFPVRKVLDEHNIVANQVKTSIAAEPNLLKRWYMQFQLKKTQRYESEMCSKMNCCFVCSDTDRAYLLDMAKTAQVRTIPNGVDLDYFTDKSWYNPTTHAQEPYAIIFVGMLDYGPGGSAIRYFCKEILPLLQPNVPDLRFYVVGQNPPNYLKTLAHQHKNIVLTGRVDDIRPYVAKSKVFVVPLISGSGTRLKILDAMAMGIPVVSTSLGAEGLNSRSGEHILIADTPEAFSSAVLQLLTDDTLAENIRKNAFQFIRDKYSWKKIWIDLLNAYKELEQIS